jgi:dUTP pyrophosphatase
MTVRLAIRRLSPHATIPGYQTPGSAGLDIHACLPDSPVTLAPGDIAIIPTGLALAIPTGFEAQVRPRSGLATRHGLSIPNAPGTIDSDYRGELKIALINLGREPFTITHGLRIVQLVIAPVARAEVEVVEELDPTARGSGGFGSTGR